MVDFSLIEKLKALMNLISSSPLFLFCCMLGVAVLILYLISIKKNKNINKWIFICIWIFLALILIFNYNTIILDLIDNLFDNLFSALYFPDLAVYIVILIISNFTFFYSVISKKLSKKNKVLNFISALIIDVLLIPIIDIVQKNNINIYEKLTVYSNTNLLILLELTSAIFTSWILISLLFKAYSKLKKYDKVNKKPEIVFEDI